jgi:hypothetical protein
LINEVVTGQIKIPHERLAAWMNCTYKTNF